MAEPAGREATPVTFGIGTRVANFPSGRGTQRRLVVRRGRRVYLDTPWGRRFLGGADNRRPLWMLRLPHWVWKWLPW